MKTLAINEVSTIRWDASDIQKLPRSFDWRDEISLESPRSQGDCGSCWSIAIAGMLGDRLRVWKHKHANDDDSHEYRAPIISHQHILECYTGCIEYAGNKGCSEKCEGGFLAATLLEIQERGAVEQSKAYQPCKDGACTRKFPCARRGQLWSIDTFYNANVFDTFAQLNLGTNHVLMNRVQKKQNMNNIMCEIFHRGPVACVLNLFSDFDTYWQAGDNVYRVGYQNRHDIPVSQRQLGSMDWTVENPGPNGLYLKEMHAVVIVGWGETDSGEKYWVVRNSWGPTGPMRGYFRVERGRNAVGIESSVYGCWFEKNPFPKIKPAISAKKIAPHPVKSINFSKSNFTGNDTGNNYTIALTLSITLLLALAYTLYATKPL